jgi:hypothetical protein
MTWFVTRKQDGTLGSIHRDHMEGYNNEQLADSDPAIVAFHAAAQPGPFPPTPRDWLERLWPNKQAAVAPGAAANAQILLRLLKASGSTTIDITLQETKDGVAALVSAGILTADDQAVLLAP